MDGWAVGIAPAVAGGSVGVLGFVVDPGSWILRPGPSARMGPARWPACLKVAVDEGRQLRLGKGADLCRLHLAVLEQHQRRDPADAEGGRGPAVLSMFSLATLSRPRTRRRSPRAAARSSCRGRTSLPRSRPARAWATSPRQSQKYVRQMNDQFAHWRFSGLQRSGRDAGDAGRHR